jgi:hypothetical protein
MDRGPMGRRGAMGPPGVLTIDYTSKKKNLTN